ncbi:MAG: amidohydrolase [Neofamilia sp.]
MDISKEVNKYIDELIILRRHFHMYPELGFQEFKTQEYIVNYLVNYLENLGLSPKRMAKTGVVALLEGNGPGKTLMLRADMDAVMVEEEADVDYKSKNPGIMHACGHDGHMAMMLITAKILTENKDKFSGNVKFVFQPNEEDAGAYLMVREGVLENPKVDAAMAIHLWSPIETGMMSIQEGPVMGAMDIFRLEILGKGGHTALPQDALDPIYIASQVVINIQAIQTKEINPLTPTTISVAKLVSGTSPNIIPSKAELEGTIRYLYNRTFTSGTKEFGGDYASIVPLMPTGIDAGACHLTWTDEKYKDGDIVIFELAGAYKRYHSPMSRTISLGKPTQKLEDTAKITIEGLNMALDFIKPGVTAEEVEAVWSNNLKRYGLEKESRIGYSTGLNYPPDWGEHTISLRPGDKTVLQKNMTLHVIPGMYYEDFGVEISEAILITETGCEPLANVERKLFIK